MYETNILWLPLNFLCLSINLGDVFLTIKKSILRITPDAVLSRKNIGRYNCVALCVKQTTVEKKSKNVFLIV